MWQIEQGKMESSIDIQTFHEFGTNMHLPATDFALHDFVTDNLGHEQRQKISIRTSHDREENDLGL